MTRGSSEIVVESGLGLESMGELIAKKSISTLQLVAHIETADGKLVLINVLPDTGSSHNILDRKAAKRAGLTGFSCRYRVTGHGGHTTEHEAECGEMTLVNPKCQQEKHHVRFYSYENPCGEFFPTDWQKMKKGWAHLKGLDILEPVPEYPIEMILGCENLALFEAVKPSAMRGPSDPVARLTPLGWMIGGKTYPEPSPDAEGDSRMVSGDCGVALGKDKQEKEVRSLNTIKNKDLSTNQQPFTDGKCLPAGCREDCQRDWETLREKHKKGVGIRD